MTSVRLTLDHTHTANCCLVPAFPRCMPVYQTNLVPISDTSPPTRSPGPPSSISYSNASVTTSQDNRFPVASTSPSYTADRWLATPVPLHNAGIPNEPSPKFGHLPQTFYEETIARLRPTFSMTFCPGDGRITLQMGVCGGNPQNRSKMSDSPVFFEGILRFQRVV